MIDKYDRVPWLRTEEAPHEEKTIHERRQCQGTNHSDDVKTPDGLHELNTGCLHARSADAGQRHGWVARFQRPGEIGSVKIAGGFPGYNENARHGITAGKRLLGHFVVREA